MRIGRAWVSTKHLGLVLMLVGFVIVGVAFMLARLSGNSAFIFLFALGWGVGALGFLVHAIKALSGRK